MTEHAQAVARPAADTTNESGEMKTAFDCNICIEQAKDPVVTLCGHLYCWPCLYRWLQVQKGCHSCPVCKAGVETDKVIPLYGRGCDAIDPRKNPVYVQPQEADVPRRPQAQRPLPIQRVVSPDRYSVQPGLGIIPTLLGYQQTHGPTGLRDPLTPEQQHQVRRRRELREEDKKLRVQVLRKG